MNGRPRHWRRTRLIVSSALLIGTVTLPRIGAQTAATRITRATPWAGRGVWLKADLHTQTRFSDGAQTVSEVVAAAVTHGCDVVGITDHADAELRAATPEYLQAIAAARAEAPALAVIAGLEWNVPPGRGDEHALVLFPPALETAETFGAFKTKFDAWRKTDEAKASPVDGLRSLRPADRNAVAPVVIVNHPSRRPASAFAPRATFAALQRAVPDILVGFEGAPGHQKGAPLGAYERGVVPIDRWDPLAAEPGGAWDEWLKSGMDVWGAIANSDFHDPRGDYWPCEFSRTWIYAPDRSIDGVLRALRAGSLFAEHGHIVSRADLQVAVSGLPRALMAGEAAAVPLRASATVTLRLDIPATDFAGRPNRIDVVEILAITAEGTQTVLSAAPAGAAPLTATLQVPPGGVVVRARGRRALEGEPALLFYTNPIRLSAPLS